MPVSSAIKSKPKTKRKGYKNSKMSDLFKVLDKNGK